MVRVTARLSVALLLAATAPALAVEPATASESTTARMDDYAQERMAANGTSGLAYAVVGPEGVEHQGVFGTDGDGAPVTEQTPFLWGSVAKPVAATAALTLVEDGRLDLDAPVSAYLTEFDGARVDPTVRELLTQTSGITEAATLAVTDVYGPGSADVRERVAEVADAAPGTPGEHEYSSANYLVLGAVITEVTGSDYSSYLRSAVLEPAGMDRTVTGAEDARDLDLAPGQRTLWGLPAPVAPRVDDGGAAYGYLGGDLGALAAFAELQLSPEPAVLDADTLDEARTGTAPVPGSDQKYGLGWRETTLSGTEVPAAFHGGATPGYTAMLIVLPGHERAVVVLQNTYDMLRDDQVQALGFGLAHLVAGAAPPDPGPAVLHGAAVWGTAALAVSAVAGAVLSLRTPARRPWTRVLLGVLGVASAGIVALVALGGSTALLWLPDVTLALLLAALAGLVPAARILWSRVRPRA